jgi:hypothetical protein
LRLLVLLVHQSRHLIGDVRCVRRHVFVDLIRAQIARIGGAGGGLRHIHASLNARLRGIGVVGSLLETKILGCCHRRDKSVWIARILLERRLCGLLSLRIDAIISSEHLGRDRNLLTGLLSFPAHGLYSAISNVWPVFAP